MQVMEVNGHRLAVGFRVVLVRDWLQQEVFNRLQLLIQGLRRLSFAKTRFNCVFNNLACLFPSQNFRDQNSILA
jgi:hypothetical protein